MSNAEKPMGRWSCLFAALVLLAVFSLAAFSLLLAVRGEVRWNRGEARGRVFLVLETHAQGIGLEDVRPVTAEEGVVCQRTRVRYLLWKGAGENVEYCECGGAEASCP